MSLRTHWKSRRFAVGMLAVTLSLFAFPADAGAQEAEDGASSGFELLGSIGALTPLAQLAESDETITGDTVTAEFSTRIAFAAELDYWFGDFGIGVVGGYSNPELTIQIAPPGDIGFSVPLQLGSTDYFMLTGNLMWRPGLSGSAAIVRPYLGVGAGMVSITYPKSDDFTIEDETRFTGTLLAGAHIALSKGWFFRVDIRDYISQLNTEPFQESKMQHDLVTSIGIGYAFN